MKIYEKDLKKLESVTFRNEFLVLLYNGYTLGEACARLAFNPGALGFYMKDNPDFMADVRQAQAFRTEIMVEKLEKINEIEANALMASVISKNIQWLAGKRNRSQYGDKLDVNHNVTINIKDAMAQAKARTLQLVQANTLPVLDIPADIKSDEMVIETENLDCLD